MEIEQMYFNFAFNFNMTLHLLITLLNNLDPDQAQHSVRTR